ncbi:hypothetical protein [Fluviicola sp.]|uniref:hypothetical protein n=1 Tax=Fluviicola sp. TaxID=1917219 RepID=UPI0031E361C7
MIRIALLTLVLGLVASCHPPKDVSVAQPQPETKTGNPQPVVTDNGIYFLGEVQILDCGVVIQVFSGETQHKYSPLNLDPKFHVDKLRLKLKFVELDEQATICSEFRAIDIKEAFAVR